MLPEAGSLPSDSLSQSSCDHRASQDSSSQPEKPRPEDVDQLPLNHCQEVARGIKHDVTGVQLPSCLLSAHCACASDVIAGAYTSTASLQLFETPCTLQETYYSTTVPCQSSPRPAGSCGEESTHHVTLQRLNLRHADAVLIPNSKLPGYLDAWTA